MAATEISREQWERETERLCPSGQAFNAYLGLEQFIVENTDLTCAYTSVTRGKSDYATFYASAGDKLAVIQVYKGQCQLNWRMKPKMASLTEEEHAECHNIYEEFRMSLTGKEGKGWETVKVLRLGEDEVQEAVKKLADNLLNVIVKPEKAK
ncbi:MAG: hypothetical protein ACI87E_001252 [Mariniblastus sp.]|jgi:hypothetical protein